MRRPIPLKITAAQINAITGLDFGQREVTAWQKNLEVLAGGCLEKIESTEKRKVALKNLIAHFLIIQGKGQKTSESLGDASESYKDAGKGSNATSYGNLARQLAPCLGAIMGDRQAGVMLIR